MVNRCLFTGTRPAGATRAAFEPPGRLCSGTTAATGPWTESSQTVYPMSMTSGHQPRDNRSPRGCHTPPPVRGVSRWATGGARLIFEVPLTAVSPGEGYFVPERTPGITVSTSHKAQTIGTTRHLYAVRPLVHSASYRPGRDTTNLDVNSNCSHSPKLALAR